MFCEHCGDGPTCCICGRDDTARPVVLTAEVAAMLESIGYAVCDLDSRGPWVE